LFSVAEIVLDIITLGFENVEGLVFDLPAGAPERGAFDHGVAANRQVGDEAVAVSDGAVGFDDLDFEPVDFERILAVAQRDFSIQR
jgi:hypothetical protein